MKTHLSKQDTLQNYRQRLLKTLLYIEKHLDHEIVLEDLAQVANFSLYHFHRIFTRMMGESVKNYIRRLRFDRAAHRLRNTKKLIIDIAFDAGYETPEAFSRAFQQKFINNPSMYRKKIWQERKRSLQKFINTLPKGELPMKVNIQNIASIRVACVRHIGSYMQCEKAWDILCAHLPKEIKLNPNAKYIGICHDDPDITSEDKTRYDACVSIPEDFMPKAEGVHVKNISGGKYIVAEHIGAYSELGAIYRELYGSWIPRNNYQPKSEPSFEVYKNDPKITPPEKLITEIYIPIE